MDASVNSALLSRLGLASQNPGAWSGSGGWSNAASQASLIDVKNPSNGQLLGQVRGATAEDYERVMKSAVETAAQWRTVPAPKRGEIVRLIGEELRKHKDDLGRLVSLENGKILAKAWAKCRK